jgi:putative membrane protein
VSDPQPTDPAGPPRWPGWVYGAGKEPDYRFSFANERTFLAWLRTSLALLAAGVALDAIDLSIPSSVQLALALLFVSLGLLCGVAAWVRWARSERAMRRGEPLPAQGFAALLASAVVLSSLLLLLVLL